MKNVFEAQISNIEHEFSAVLSPDKKVFATTSCQSNSVVLLHLLQRFRPQTEVFFLNTGYLFAETLLFKDQLAQYFGLTITTLRSNTLPIQQRNHQGRQLYTSDPDYCCHINKVLPLEPVLLRNDFWINGIRGTQSNTRSNMKRFQSIRDNVVRYHPLLDWDSRMVYYYIQEYNLPKHPLDDKGYKSIGCQPCTRSYLDGMDNREGRWQGLNKTECGLHTTLGSSPQK
jgi:phosphoadenosine phosphosulfate reductase